MVATSNSNDDHDDQTHDETDANRATLSSAIQALASRCDGTAERDGTGFNMFDAPFGHRLAILPQDQWTPRQRAAAHKMLHKYSEQLAEMGIRYDEIPAPRLAHASGTAAHLQELPKLPTPLIEFHVRSQEVVELEFDYDAEMVAELKDAVPQALRTYDRLTRRWQVVLDKDSIEGLARFADAYDLIFPEHISAFMLQHPQRRAANIAQSTALSTDATIDVPGLKLQLRPFQEAAVHYLLGHRRTLLADQMGLGKSAECLAAMLAAGADPILIVCPASLKNTWKLEVEKWTGLTCQIISGGKRVSFTADVVIINYDILQRHLPALIAHKFLRMAVDESHYIKSDKTARSKAVSELARVIPTVYLLTGTPMLNRPFELANQLATLGVLDQFGGFWGFVTRYCDATKTKYGWDFTGAQNLGELAEKLRAVCMMKRTTRDVLTELPAVQRTALVVDITNRAEYKTAERDVLSYVAWLARENKAFTASISHLPADEQESLKAARAASAAHKAAQAEQLVRLEKLKHLAATGKLAAVRDWIGDYLLGTEPEDKLLIFADHRDIQQSLIDTFPQAVAITAAQSPAERQAAVDRFQSDPTVRLAIISLKVGGVGFTMTAARHVMFCEFAWRPADHDQAEGRAYGRLNDPHPVTAYYVEGIGTIDGSLIALLDRKRHIIDAALATGQAVPEPNVIHDLIAALAARADEASAGVKGGKRSKGATTAPETKSVQDAGDLPDETNAA